MKLNDRQLRAVQELERDLLVVAGAGTGKTSVLTEKYLLLLERERLDPRRIVAFTFTRKAAFEMRARIRRAIEERMNDSGGESARFWRLQREGLENSYIGTFHGFCALILRENPLQSGILPDTRVLSEGEERILLAAAAEKACLRAVEEGGDQEKELFWQAATLFGLDFFLKHLREICPKLRETGSPLHELLGAKCRPQPVDGLIAYLRERINEILQADCRRRSSSRSQMLLDEIESNLHDWLPAADAQLAEAVDRLEILREHLPKNMGKELRPYIDAVHEAIDALLSGWSENEFRRWLSCAGRFLILLAQEYERAKKLEGGMDFADLQLKARDLLRDHREIRRAYQERYDYFLLDEFQDTNLLQLEIVRLLVGEGHAKGRLFVVGDPKQSIYRFRGAQVEVVRRLQTELSNRGGAVLPLVDNYRCHPALIDVINEIAGKLFSAEPIEYHPLVASRTDGGEDPARVSVILNGEDSREVEAEKLAVFLSDLVTAGRCRIEEGGRLRPIRFGDIAVLLRAMTHAEIYATALRNRGVPVVIGSGSGYYGLQEVRDQLNLVRLVQNSQDGLALLALLRSPYAGLSDADLYWLAKDRGDMLATFYEADQQPRGIDAPAWRRVLRLRRVVRELQLNRSFLSVSEIINYALKELGYQDVVSAFPGAERSLANLDKLIQKADAFAAVGGRYGIGQFLEYIGNLIAFEEREGEANLENEGNDAVQILSVHAAKGLEFPLVVLADLERKLFQPERSPVLFHPDQGIGFKVPDGRGTLLDSPARRAIRERILEEERSEAKRLLYVALTRAKDFLVLSGINETAGAGAEGGQSWAGWLKAMFPEGYARQDCFEFGARKIDVIREIPVPPTAAGEPSDDWLQSLQARAETAGTDEIVPPGSLAAVPGRTRRRISVTSLLTYLNCPREYYLKHILGLDESDDVTGGQRNGFGALTGRIVHALCALEKPDPDIAEELIRNGLASLPAVSRAEAETSVRRLWGQYLHSPYPRLEGKTFSEYPFTIALGSRCLLHGVVDRVVDSPKEGLVLVDFKTDRTEGPADLERLAERYRPQLMTYAYALRVLFHRLPRRVELFFLDAGERRQLALDNQAVDQWGESLLQACETMAHGSRIEDFPAVRDCSRCPRSKWCPAETPVLE